MHRRHVSPGILNKCPCDFKGRNRSWVSSLPPPSPSPHSLPVLPLLSPSHLLIYLASLASSLLSMELFWVIENREFLPVRKWVRLLCWENHCSVLPDNRASLLPSPESQRPPQALGNWPDVQWFTICMCTWGHVPVLLWTEVELNWRRVWSNNRQDSLGTFIPSLHWK